MYSWTKDFINSSRLTLAWS